MKTLTFAALLVAGWVAGVAIATPPDARPNILWITTDDHRVDSLAAYNRAVTGRDASPLGYVSSPRIDALAAEGTMFTNAWCNSPACAPSRSSMMTGKYPHRNGMYGFRKAHQALDAGVRSSMLPEVMNAHGYRSGHFGKSGYYIFDWAGFPQWKDPGDFDPWVSFNSLWQLDDSDHWFNKPWGQVNGKGMVKGVEEVYRFADGTTRRFWRERKDQPLTETDLAERAAVEAELDILRSHPRSNPTLIIGGVSPNTTENTLDGAIVKSFARYLAHPDTDYTGLAGKTMRGPESGQPLFLHLGFHFPHTPVLPSAEFRAKFADKVYNVPEFLEAEADRLPKNLRQLRDDMDFSRMTDAEKQQAIRDYYAFCAMGDHLVGEAVDAFKAYCEQQAQPWAIVFVCGDHGWHLGEQGIEAKFGPWDKSNRGAVIVASSTPGAFPPGAINRDFVEYVDFAPTFYDLADVPHAAHPGLDGISLIKTLAGEAGRRDYVIGELNQVRGARAHLRSRGFSFAMRSRPYATKPGQGYAPGERERWGLDAPRDEVEMALYDLRVDPDERVNVADDPRYVPLADFFRDKLGRIVLGDGRLEVDWSKQNDYHVGRFAPGAHDRVLEFPAGLVPDPVPTGAHLGLLSLTDEPADVPAEISR